MGPTSRTRRSSSTGSASSRGEPGAASTSSSRMPSCSWPSPSSRAEQSIPSDGSPRIFRRSSVIPPGRVTPIRAKGYFLPARTFGAPHTTLRRVSVPSFTRQRRRRSALGCGRTDSTRPMTTCVEPRMQRLDRVHRNAQHGQPAGEVGGVEPPPKECLEPTTGDVHRLTGGRADGRTATGRRADGPTDRSFPIDAVSEQRGHSTAASSFFGPSAVGPSDRRSAWAHFRTAPGTAYPPRTTAGCR